MVRQTVPVALTIAGSDSGGGAGIQADLKTFAALGVFGTSAITCLTAQNPDAVTRVEPVDPGMVVEQVKAVCAGFPVKAVKTGMLFSRDIIRAVARVIRQASFRAVVVDPVMVATSGARLLREDAVTALCRDLLPLATVLTPNLPEAELLWGKAIESETGQAAAARRIAERFGTACVVKGGHLSGRQVTDLLFLKGRVYRFEAPRLHAVETHGTGCTFSAALAALLAKGLKLPAAVQAAQRYVGQCLATSVQAGSHRPMGWTFRMPFALRQR